MKGLLFVYIMTYGDAIVGLFNPFIGLLIYISFAILKPEDLWSWSVPAGNYSRILALAMLAGWILHGFGSFRFRRARTVVLALLFFWVWLLVSCLFARDRALTLVFVEQFSKIAIAFLVGITLIDSVTKLRMVAWTIVISQGYLAYEFNVTHYTSGIIAAEFTFASLDNNGIAVGMVACIPLAFFLGLHSKRLWEKGAAFTAAGLMAHVVLFSNSRGGMLALLVIGVVTFIILPKRLSNCVLFLLAVLLGLRLAGPEVQRRFVTIESAANQDTSAKLRIRHWQACWDSTLKNPLVGVGPSNWPLVGPEYGLPPGMAAHSTWMQLVAEAGIPALLGLGLFFGACIVAVWPLTRGRTPLPDPWYRSVACMVIPALIGYVVAAQFVSLALLEHPYYVTLLGAGLLKLHAPAARGRNVRRPGPPQGLHSVKARGDPVTGGNGTARAGSLRFRTP